MYFASFMVKNLTRRPIRTALTVLGLAVAVGSMIALLGISDNVERSVGEAFERRGVDLVVLKTGVPNQLDSELDENLVDRVKSLDGVEDVDVALVSLIDVKMKSGNSISAMCLGWPSSNFGYHDLDIVAGRALHDGDRQKTMLGAKLADTLNMGVGDTLEVSGEPFEIVGLYKSFNVYETGALIILMEEAQRLSGRKGKVTGFSLRVHKSIEHPDADVEAVRRKIEALTDENGKPARLSAQTIQEYVKTASHVLLVRAMAWMVSIIAIIIGVISMLDTMIMSVLERTQEIGILRAVGWPRSRVVKMVLIEAVMLGLAAAALGSVGAIALTYILTLFPKVSGFIESGIAPIVIAKGFGLTVLIGLAGAAYPAIRAARLLPTEAIRHD